MSHTDPDYSNTINIKETCKDKMIDILKGKFNQFYTKNELE